MSLRESKSLAWIAMLLMVIVVMMSIILGLTTAWWELGALFLAFMAVFCHLAAVLLVKMSKTASNKLDIGAVVFGILAVLAFIAIFVVNFVDFY